MNTVFKIFLDLSGRIVLITFGILDQMEQSQEYNFNLRETAFLAVELWNGQPWEV